MSHASLLTNEEIAEKLFAEKILTSRNTKRVRELIDEAVVYLLTEHETFEAAERGEKHLRLLESRLCKKFGLLDARVHPAGEPHSAAEYAGLLKRYGRTAAAYFDEISSTAEDNGEQLHVAVSGGQTILDMVSHLAERRRPNVHYYSAALIGRGGERASVHIGPETNASVAWSRSGRIPQHLFYGTVPPYDFKGEDRKGIPKKQIHNWVRGEILKQVKGFAATEAIGTVLKLTFQNVNMAIAGLGLVRPSTIDADYGTSHVERITMTNLLKPLGIDLDCLAEEGACGEISYCMFDRKGRGNPRWNFFAMPGEGTPYSGVEFYRRLVDQGKRVIVIAGARKWDALVPAINARLFNVLITDAHTAHRLLIG
jgi:DNA-binding transcriptional regulator LsrR (DeoR family)